MITIDAVARRNGDLLYHRESKIRRIALPKRYPTATRTEQRRAKRYPLDLELTYTVVFKGLTVDAGRGPKHRLEQQRTSICRRTADWTGTDS